MNDFENIMSGFFDEYLTNNIKKYAALLEINAVFKHNAENPPKNLNIGGGPNFLKKDWANLESIWASRNPIPYHIEKNKPFPYADNSFERIYWSHNIEHLWPDVVEWVLHEVRRILKPGGKLVLLMPDYDAVLDCYRKGDDSYMYSPSTCGFGWVIPYWKNLGIPDTLAYRSANVFVQWQNPQWGSPMAIYTSMAPPQCPDGYVGPPRMPEEQIHELLMNERPTQIAKVMREYVLENEKAPFIHHISAWDREELKAMLIPYGFNEFDFDRESVYNQNTDIDGIVNNYNFSTFLSATMDK